MSEKKPSEQYLPPAQILLLRAALLPDAKAVAAFSEWQKNIDFEALDDVSYRFLPTLYLNLRAQPVKSDLLPRIKGVYRKTWLANQLSKRQWRGVFDSLDAGGIQFAVLSAAPRVWEIYGDEGAAALADNRILVSSEQFSAALKTLQKSGGQLLNSPAANGGDVRLRFGDDRDICLRRCPSREFAAIWDAAENLRLAETTVKIISREEQILRLGAEEFATRRRSAGRWVFAAAILRNQSDLDWQKITVGAKKRRISFAAAEMLSFLAENFAVKIPETVLDELRRAPQPGMFSLANGRKSLAAYRSLRRAYLKNARLNEHPPSWKGFAGFLRAHWKTNSAAGLLREAGRRFRRLSQTNF